MVEKQTCAVTSKYLYEHANNNYFIFYRHHNMVKATHFNVKTILTVQII